MTADHAATDLSQERQDLLESFAIQRYFLLHTAEGLNEEQARDRSTVSELTIGGLIKHVTAVEADWMRFIVEGPAAPDAEAMATWGDQFVMGPEQTLAEVMADYQQVAATTDELVRTTDLDHSQPLPEAPWFPPGATRTARRVFTHMIAELAQHAGHADIIRETIDGQKSMG